MPLLFLKEARWELSNVSAVQHRARGPPICATVRRSCSSAL